MRRGIFTEKFGHRHIQTLAYLHKRADSRHCISHKEFVEPRIGYVSFLCKAVDRPVALFKHFCNAVYDKEIQFTAAIDPADETPNAVGEHTVIYTAKVKGTNTYRIEVDGKEYFADDTKLSKNKPDENSDNGGD